MDVRQSTVRVLRQETVESSQTTKEQEASRAHEEQPYQIQNRDSVEGSVPAVANGTTTGSPLEETHHREFMSPSEAFVQSSNPDTYSRDAAEPNVANDGGASVLSADDTTSSAAPRNRQSAEYISWLERRLGSVEQELRIRRNAAFLEDSKEEFDKEAEASHDEFDKEQILEGRSVNLEEFRSIKDKYEVTKGNVILYAVAERREVGVQISAEKETMVPYRLAINSCCVLDLLGLFHKSAKLYNVHLRPFKFLICYQKELKEKLEQLTSQCAELETSGTGKLEGATNERLPSHAKDKSDIHGVDVPSNAAGKPTENLQVDLEKKHLLREHLKVLTSFMDHEMDEIFRRRKILDEAGQDEILFEDLYHLFRPGQLVYTKTGQDENSRLAFRVLHVTGGRSIRDVAGNLGVNADGSEAGGKLDADLFEWSLEGFGQTQQRVPGSNVKMSAVIIDCCYTEYDGEYYGPKSVRFVILEYEGTKPIRHLDIYPAHYDADPERSHRILLERGRRFVDSAEVRIFACNPLRRICDLLPEDISKLYANFGKIQHRTYTGRPMADAKSFVEDINGEVILDHGQGIKMEKQVEKQVIFGDGFIEEPSKWDRREAFKSTALDPATIGTDLWWDYEIDRKLRSDFIESESGRLVLATQKYPNDEQVILLPVRIWGYVLTERKWYQLNINNVRDVQRNGNPDDGAIRSFNDLVLPPSHKMLVQALVKNQMRIQNASLSDADTNLSQSRTEQLPGQSTSLDLVRGKGRGLIILLHGVPGVGKTSTAECVAAQLGRPLFPITCGDLGTNAEAVENKLDAFFFLAQKWRCVLLLDEADVFLARRSAGDFTRNGIVSVFLRVLETFSGVLILTTNRVGEFDEAFRSRIHVSLYYPRLDAKSTADIYDVNLRRIRDHESLDIDVEEEAIRDFGRKHFRDNEDAPSRRWNGRQIKNAFQTAIALANWDFFDQSYRSSDPKAKPTLAAKHFEYVALTSSDFDEYLDHVHQSSGAGAYTEIAADNRWRKDEFKPRTSSIGQRRSARASRNQMNDWKMATTLSPTATNDDTETRIKKLKSQLKNVDKMKFPQERADELRLEWMSELEALGVDDAFSVTDGEDGSKQESNTPWAPWA